MQHLIFLVMNKTSRYLLKTTLYRWWRVIAKALGDKAHHDDRLVDQVALVRFLILSAYMLTNALICAGVIRHWNN